MRPIERGAIPTYDTGKQKGLPVVFTQYAKWRRHLIDRLGMYCVFCNMPLTHKLEVEHERPKSQPGVNPLAWDNLALGCNTCNTKKGAQPTDPATHYLPGHHNTHLAFDYVAGTYQYRRKPRPMIEAKPAAALTPAQQQKAQATIDLVGLNAVDERPNVSNLRWKRRNSAGELVARTLRNYETILARTPVSVAELAEMVADAASGTGFFSLWFAAFTPHPQVLRRLLDPAVFPGTATTCFDAAAGYQPVPRNPAYVADPL